MLDRIIKIEQQKWRAIEEENKLSICPKCNKKMYGKIGGPRAGGFSCLECGYWIMF